MMNKGRKVKGLIVENNKIILRDGLELPSCKENQVLIRVIYASVNPTDVDMVKGSLDFWLKLSGGNHRVKTGLEFSGVIEQGASRFKKGDKVFGYVDLMKGLKTHQEYITINEDYIAMMPPSLNFEQSSSLPLGSLTSLVALQELGKVGAGTKDLINGASGGLGVYATQIAKNLGAKVTAVAGPNQEEFLKSLGANTVINYKKENIKDLSEKFDVIFDLTTNLKFKEIKNILSENGKFIPTDPTKNIKDFFGNIFSSKKTKYLMVQSGNHEKLSQIASWVEDGKMQAFVDSTYSLSTYEEAFKRLDVSGRRGRIVMKIGEE